MLIITRQPTQSVIIGDDIVIKVLKIHGKTVRFEVNTRPDVSVHHINHKGNHSVIKSPLNKLAGVSTDVVVAEEA